MTNILLIAPEAERPVQPAFVASLSSRLDTLMRSIRAQNLKSAPNFVEPPYDGYQASRGLLLIGGALLRAGHSVRYIQIDYLLQSKPDAAVEADIRVAAQWADVIGVTSYTPTHALAERWMRVCKNAHPECIVVVGGPHATYATLATLNNRDVDAVIRGPGVCAMLALVERRSEMRTWDQIPGLAWRDRGIVRQNKNEGPRDHPDEFATPAYELLPVEDRRAFAIIVETSRGCPFKCVFCVESELWDGVYYRPLDAVFAELETLHNELGFTHVFICDPIFPTKAARLQDFREKLRSSRLELSFGCNVRGDRADPNLLSMLAAVGVREILVGVESYSSEVLARMKKRATSEQYDQFFSVARSYFPMISTSWMIGHPGETAGGVAASIAGVQRLIRDGLVDDISPKIFVPYPGTPVLNENTADFEVKTWDWSRYSRVAIPPVFRLSDLDEEAIVRGYVAFLAAAVDSFERRLRSESFCSQQALQELDSFVTETSLSW